MIARTPQDGWTKEMAKWEQRPVYVNGAYIEPIPVAEGGRLGVDLTEYPKMVYQAESADGGPRITGFKIVNDSGEEAIAVGQGWCARQEDAIAGVHARHLELAKQAANRVYNERWMSDKAKAEAAEADETTIEHLAVLPEKPVRKRRTKAEMAAANDNA